MNKLQQWLLYAVMLLRPCTFLPFHVRNNAKPSTESEHFWKMAITLKDLCYFMQCELAPTRCQNIKKKILKKSAIWYVNEPSKVRDPLTKRIRR